MSASARTLKEEANEFFREQQYQLACDKYGEAIKLDAKNSVLFANRALCRLKLKHYIDALSDADMAVQLDPTYAKAHARCADAYDALHRYSDSIESWNAAINALPKRNLLPFQTKLKESFERSKNKVAEKVLALKAAVSCNSFEGALYPAPLWKRAEEVLEKMVAEGKDCSGTCAQHLVHVFTTYWTATLIISDTLRSADNDIYPLTALTAALMYDERVCDTWDDVWYEKLDKIVEKLNITLDGWRNLKPDEEFKKAVLQRLAEKGWDWTSEALAVTIDSWILEGMLGSRLNRFDHVLQFIEWAKSVWAPDVLATVIRIGHMFEPNFILSMKKFRMNALLVVTTLIPKENDSDNEGLELLNQVLWAAEDVVQMASTVTRDGLELPELGIFLLDMPCGEAHFTIGHCYVALLKYIPECKADLLEKAYQSQLEAAKYLPKDDIFRAVSLHCALRCMMKCGSALATLQLETLQDLEDTLTAVLPIWAVPECEEKIREIMDMIDRANILKRLLLKEGDVCRWAFDKDDLPTFAEVVVNDSTNDVDEAAQTLTGLPVDDSV